MKVEGLPAGVTASPAVIRQGQNQVLLTVLGAVAGAAYAAVKTPTFHDRAYVVVTAEAGEGPAAISFAQAYGRVATKGPAAEKAAATLGGGSELNQVTASTSTDAPVIEIVATHTMSDEHIAWFRAGSALNVLRQS